MNIKSPTCNWAQITHILKTLALMKSALKKINWIGVR